MQPPSERPVRFHEYQPPGQEPVSVLNWVATLLVLAIPLVNLILYIYWATSDFTAPSKRNYCRACILLFVIALGLSLVFGLLMGGLFYAGGHRIR